MTNTLCKQCNKELLEGTHSNALYCSKFCKAEFHRYNKKKFCSCGAPICNVANLCKRCAYAKRDLKGEKNGRWKGGTSEGYQISIYHGILKANGIDLKTCSYCGATPQRMHVHHKDGDHSNNILSNLLPLCPSCHFKEHRANDVTFNCDWCAKKITRSHSKTTNKTHLYCSRSCYYAHKKILMLGNTNSTKNKV